MSSTSARIIFTQQKDMLDKMMNQDKMKESGKERVIQNKYRED